MHGAIACVAKLYPEVVLVVGKDRRTLLKGWLDEKQLWDVWLVERDRLVETGVDEEAAHWLAARSVGYEGTAPPRRKVSAPAIPQEFGEGSIRGDFDWVYRNVSVESVTSVDAPSSGAWGLLQFARNDPRAFYTKWMDITSRNDDREQVLEGFREDSRRRTEEIAEMLHSYRAARDAADDSDE